MYASNCHSMTTLLVVLFVTAITCICTPALAQSTPSAPQDLTCEPSPFVSGTLLEWTNPQTYTSITVECNGVFIATLPGNATFYVHAANPPLPGECCRVIGVIVDASGITTEYPSEECCRDCEPPFDLTCVTPPLAGLGVPLRWTNPQVYSSINVECNGVIVMTLPGTATSYVHMPVLPYECCRLIGIVVNSDGTTTECASEECCIGCEHPTNVVCELINMQLVLNWTNASGGYDAIHIYCNGVLQAVLSGTATTYNAGTPPSGTVCCQVVGTVTSLAGGQLECPSEECCIGCEPPVNLTCVPDPLAIGTLLNWTNPQVYSSINVECNGVIVATLAGTATSYSHIVTPPLPQECCRVIGIIVNSDGTTTECPSEECCTGCEHPTNVVCELINMQLVLNWTNVGSYDAIHIYCNGVLQAVLSGTATTYNAGTPPSGTVCCQVVGTITGSAGGPPLECPSEECCIGCEPPVNLTCVPDPLAIGTLLNWTNPQVYSSINVECNGVIVATLAGTATSYSHIVTPPLPEECCRVIGIIVNSDGTTTECPSEECCTGCEAPVMINCYYDTTLDTIVVNWSNAQAYSAIQVWCNGVYTWAMMGTATSYTETGATPGTTRCYYLVGEVLNADGTVTECASIECCVDVPSDGPCPKEDLVVLLNTGYDDGSGTVIGLGNPDDDWIVVDDRNLSNDSTVPPFSTTPEPVPAEIRSTHPAWDGPLVGPGATGSAWVYHSINSQNGYFDYQRCFCLREGYSNPSLTFTILADDQADVYLNDVLIYSTGPTAFITELSHTVTDPTLFHAGENCLLVTVANTLGVVTGLNLVGEVTATDGKCCCTPPPPGMVGWWPLDSNGTDIAWGNNGNPSTPAYQPGIVAESMFFDGNNQFLVPDNSALDFGAPNGIAVGDFSIDAWIRMDDAIDGPHPIVSKFGQNGATPGYILYVGATGNLEFIVQDSNISGQYAPTSAAAFVNDGAWHHVAVTYDRDRVGNGIRLFVDGQRVDPNTYDGTAVGSLANSGAFRIGGSNFFGGVQWEGHIDEVEVFDRVLLESEVRRLYEAGDQGKCKEYCHVPWDKPVASNGLTTVNAVVCNDSGVSQTYTVTAMPASGPGCTLPSPGVGAPATVTVPPASCVNVSLFISAPAGPGISCYKVCFENILTGHQFCCKGSMRVGSPVIVIDDDDFVTVPVGASTTVTFTLNNPGLNDITTPITVFANAMNPAIKTVSLDGLPPGVPVELVALTLTGGSSADVTVDALVIDHEPFVFYDIILMADFDGDGIQEAEASSMLRTGPSAPAPEFSRGDCNLDSAFNIGDPVFLLTYLFNNGAVPGCPDSCDGNDDGNLNVGDAVFKLSALFSGGAPPPTPFPSCGSDPTPDSLGPCVDPNCP